MQKIKRIILIIIGLFSLYLISIVHLEASRLIEIIFSNIEPAGSFFLTIITVIGATVIPFLLFIGILITGVIFTSKMLYYKEIIIAYAVLSVIAYFVGLFPESLLDIEYFIGWYALGLVGMGYRSQNKLFKNKA